MTEEIKDFELEDDALESVTGGQNVQEGWTVVLPYSTCGNWEEKVNGLGGTVGRSRDSKVEQKCSTCKHRTYISPNNYCTLGS